MPSTNIFAPTPPSPFQRLLSHPALTIAQWLYTHQPPCSPPSPLPAQTHKSTIEIVCIPDAHNAQPRIPPGDILIHAGDMTVNGSIAEVQEQLTWLNSLPHAHKVVIAGNHDVGLDPALKQQQEKKQELDWGSVTCLNESSTTIAVRDRVLRIYGSPMKPRYGNWAFQYALTSSTTDPWKDAVPESTDILITHGPARGHLDASSANPLYLQGCPLLQREVWRVKPRLHVCGHVHAARGIERSDWTRLQWYYDSVCRGDGGMGSVLCMLGVYMWLWVLCVCGMRREWTTTSVNAAVAGEEGLVEGEDSIVVEL